MVPLVVAAFQALPGWGRIARVTLQPVLDDVVIELLRPQHAGKALAHDILGIRRENLRNYGCVELIRFALAQCESPVEAVKRALPLKVGVREPQPGYYRFARTNCELVMRRCLGAGVLRIDSILGAVYHVVVDAVLHVRCAVLDSKEPPGVGLVLREEQFRRAFAMKPAIAGLSMVQLDHRVGRRACLVQLGPPIAASPRPRVAEPHSG